MNMMEEFMIIIELIDNGAPILNNGAPHEITEWKETVTKARDFLRRSEVEENVLRKVMNEGKQEKKKVRVENKGSKKGSLEALGL